MTISRFVGPYRWLSNFYPCSVQYEGLAFASVEHAYQAAKTDLGRRWQYQGITAGQAKRLGRTLPLREDWESVKLDVMRALIRQKFADGTDLGRALKATADRELIEGNTWGDTFWGVCGGHGFNHLGHLLMSQRRALRGEA